MKFLKWTPELAEKFWRDLSGSDFLANIAFSRFAAPFLVDLAGEYLDRDRSILDFGAGYNLYLVKELLDRGYKNVDYYEPSTEPGIPPEHINFRAGVRALESNKYDCVFLSEVMEHLSEDQLVSVMANLRETLKPEGLLVVSTPDSEDLENASRYCPVCRHLFHPWGHVRSFTRDQLEASLTAHGFRCMAVHNVDFSNARQPIEDFRRLKRQIASMVEDFKELQQQVTGSQEIANRVAKYVNLFRGIMPDAPQDPQHRQIGFGGTLVAFARKRAIEKLVAGT